MHQEYFNKMAENIMNEQTPDAGAHYRYGIRAKITEDDIKNGFVDINLDPFRIANIYKMDDFALMTILKKTLVAGNRGYKDLKQDLIDIICAAERKIKMIEEDDKLR